MLVTGYIVAQPSYYPNPLEEHIGCAMLVPIEIGADLNRDTVMNYQPLAFNGRESYIIIFSEVVKGNKGDWLSFYDLAKSGDLPLFHIDTHQPLNQQERDSLLSPTCFTRTTSRGRTDTTIYDTVPRPQCREDFQYPLVELYWYYDRFSHQMHASVHSMALQRRVNCFRKIYIGRDDTLAYIMPPGAIEPPSKKEQLKSADLTINQLVFVNLHPEDWSEALFVKKMMDHAMGATIYRDYQESKFTPLGDSTGSPISYKAFIDQNTTYHTYSYINPTTLLEEEYSASETINPSDVSERFLVDLSWYWDWDTYTLSVRVNKFSPLITSTDKTGNFRGYKPFFWIEND